MTMERYEVRPAKALGMFVAWDIMNQRPVYLPGQGLAAETTEDGAAEAVKTLNRLYESVRCPA